MVAIGLVPELTAEATKRRIRCREAESIKSLQL